MGTFQLSSGGWAALAINFFSSLVSSALIINIWEETAWASFVQIRLTDRHGLLIGSLLTAPAFIGIHLPLLLQQNTLPDLLESFAALAGLAFFFRYLIGMIYLETGGSTLLVGLLHASFNSSGSLGTNNTQIASIFATILITLVFARYMSLFRSKRQFADL